MVGVVYEVNKNKIRSDKLIEELLENTAKAIGLFFSFFMVFIPGGSNALLPGK